MGITNKGEIGSNGNTEQYLPIISPLNEGLRGLITPAGYGDDEHGRDAINALDVMAMSSLISMMIMMMMTTAMRLIMMMMMVMTTTTTTISAIMAKSQP